MKNFLGIIMFSLVVALLNLGLTFGGTVNLVLCVGLALLLSGNDEDAIWLTIISGLLFDLMMHGNVGATVIAVLLGFVPVIVARTLGFGDKIWQKVILGGIAIFLCFVFDLVISSVLGDGGFGMRGIWLEIMSRTGINIIVTLVLYILVTVIKERFVVRQTVKI